MFDTKSTAIDVWARLGPYRSTFPFPFAKEIIEQHSCYGDNILDPFCGRGTMVYSSLCLGRFATGIDINPVAFLFAQSKIQPQGVDKVLSRLNELKEKFNNYSNHSDDQDSFFKHCFSDEVYVFLICAREELKWNKDPIDAELMTFILHHLHGDRGRSLGNQLPSTRALRKNYSISFWKSKNIFTPPDINPFYYLEDRIKYRYRFGIPNIQKGAITLGDSTEILRKFPSNSYDMLFTSPPYIGRVNYFDDQWLRLWALGINNDNTHPYKKGFNDSSGYLKLLKKVFKECRRILKPKAKIVIRTDQRSSTLNTTLEVLRDLFPQHKLTQNYSHYNKKGLTERLGNTTNQKGEVDILLSPVIKGRPEKRGVKKRLLTISNFNYAKIKNEAANKGTSISEVAENIFTHHFKNN